jgi:hypothetical protein
MGWLERTPWWMLAIVAVPLALAPFGHSHLVEKWRMLFAGTLRRPLDWFDLVMHSAPIGLLVAKMIVTLTKR